MAGRVAIPLRGYVVCNVGGFPSTMCEAFASQSPYGAKRFATSVSLIWPSPPTIACRNPLTGLSGLQPGIYDANLTSYDDVSQSPYGAKWFATHWVVFTWEDHAERSQSPYGAKWFATQGAQGLRARMGVEVAIPLRGYVVCNLRLPHQRPPHRGVAIPLRG